MCIVCLLSGLCAGAVSVPQGLADRAQPSVAPFRYIRTKIEYQYLQISSASQGPTVRSSASFGLGTGKRVDAAILDFLHLALALRALDNTWEHAVSLTLTTGPSSGNVQLLRRRKLGQ